MTRQLLPGLCLLASLVACQRSSGAPPEVARPAQAGGGEVVARVLLLRGATEVVAQSGFTYAARPGEPLLRADRLRVGGGGAFAVLALENGYLVRLDEQSELGVGEVVLLDAPAAGELPHLQLRRLLTPEELAAGERIAGWRADLAAADSVAPMAREEAVAKEKPEFKAEPKSTLHRHKRMMDFGQDAEQAPGSGGSARPARDEQAGLLEVAGGERASDEDVPAKLSTRLPSGWLAPAGLPDWLVGLGSDPAWLACLRGVLDGLPAQVRPARLRVELEVQDGVVVRLRLGGGLPTPACLAARVPAAAPFPGREGWVRLELALP